MGLAKIKMNTLSVRRREGGSDALGKGLKSLLGGKLGTIYKNLKCKYPLTWQFYF